MSKDLISVIVPIFNEEQNIDHLIERLMNIQNKNVDFEFLFIDDGSYDNSLIKLTSYSKTNKNIKIVSLSRNFGHQSALTAGLDYSNGDYIAIIDADLQDPPELIYKMYLKAKEGYDVVYGQRIKREGESWFKKKSASLFYNFFNKIIDIKIPPNTGDFRLITKRVKESLKSMPEKNKFYRGLIPWIGFKEISFEFERSPRYAGATKYPVKKMFNFAFNAIVSFSAKPIIFAVKLGLAFLLVAFLLGLYFIYIKLFTELSVPGITSLVIILIFLSGIQIILIGLIGKYLSHIFEEVKNRPIYFVKSKQNLN